MLDTLIQNGLVFDGLGSVPIRADIGIQDGRIVAIAPLLSVQAREVVDASGLWITPGFIDIHTHYDLELEIAPGLSESVRHGVTSVVIGNCSLSIAIGEPNGSSDRWIGRHLPNTWRICSSCRWEPTLHRCLGIVPCAPP